MLCHMYKVMSNWKASTQHSWFLVNELYPSVVPQYFYMGYLYVMCVTACAVKHDYINEPRLPFSVLDANNPCDGQVNGALVADPTDCSKYYTCMSNTGTPGACASDLWWDSVNNVCNWQNQVTCTGEFSKIISHRCIILLSVSFTRSSHSILQPLQRSDKSIPLLTLWLWAISRTWLVKS